ncbi:MAG: thioredoxin family protein [Nanoarchaeota archaeon]|nr:thioredoxin family protein [Nanoarchaeota archaeon]
MKKEYWYALLMANVLFIFGCTQNTGIDVIDEESGETLKLLAGTTSKYYRFDKAHYEQSLQEGKVIFLDFHANWCPICAREKPRILAAFNELNNADIVGYEVHFNDDETTKDDIEMAKKYGITNQYTKVIIDKSDNIALKTLEILDKDRIINELNNAAGE